MNSPEFQAQLDRELRKWIKKSLFMLMLFSTLCFGLTVSGNDKVDITGRMGIGNLTCLDNAIVYIYDLTGYGQILSITARDNSRVYMSVPKLEFSTQSMSGVCFNGQEFKIAINDSETFSHISQIPEPLSLIFMVWGGYWIKTNKCHKKYSNI